MTAAARAGTHAQAAILALLLSAVPGRAQTPSRDPGRIIGQAIAAGVLLASDDFAASGRYEARDAARSTFTVRQLSGRHAFSRQGAWTPFLGLRAGEVLVGQSIALGAGLRGDSDFRVRGAAVEGGVRVELGRGWFAEARTAATYSFVESRLRYPDAETAALLGPVLDGVYFNWKAQAVTFEGGVAAGWARTLRGGADVSLGAEVVRLRTDPTATDDPLQDVTVTSRYERLSAAVELPLPGSVFGRPLRLAPRVRHTFLDPEVGGPLDSTGFTELRLAVVALRPRRSGWPERIGVALTWTTAEGFSGWSAGVTFAR